MIFNPLPITSIMAFNEDFEPCWRLFLMFSHFRWSPSQSWGKAMRTDALWWWKLEGERRRGKQRWKWSDFQTWPVFKHIRFSNTRSPRGAETRAVWIDGGIHARWGFMVSWQFWCLLFFTREWIAPATATYLLAKLVETFANNDTSTCGARAIQVVMVMATL